MSLVTQVTPDPDGEPQGAPKASPVAKQAEQPSAPLAKVIGIDRKAYNQQQPRRIPRRQLLDTFRDAVALDLQKLVVRIDKIASDNRVARDIDKIGHYADLIDQYANELHKSADKIRNANNQEGRNK